MGFFFWFYYSSLAEDFMFCNRSGFSIVGGVMFYMLSGVSIADVLDALRF